MPAVAALVLLGGALLVLISTFGSRPSHEEANVSHLRHRRRSTGEPESPYPWIAVVLALLAVTFEVESRVPASGQSEILGVSSAVFVGGHWLVAGALAAVALTLYLKGGRWASVGSRFGRLVAVVGLSIATYEVFMLIPTMVG